MKKFHFLLIILLWSSGVLLAQQSPDCEENVDAVDTTTVVSNTLQASNTLTVNRKLNSGDTLRLIGGQLIELLPGFEAEEGSFVEGANGECIDLSSPPVDCFDPCQDIGILRPINEECYYEWQNEDIPEEERNERYIEVCPEETTTYVLKVVYTDGRIEEKEYEVEVIEFEFTQSPYYLCSGESSVTLKVNTLKGYTYEWTDTPDEDVIGTGLSLEATEAGTYYFTISDECGNSYTKSVEVQSSAPPDVEVTPIDPLICFGDPQLKSELEKSANSVCALDEVEVSVEGDGSYDYEWSTGDLGSSTTITALGEYSVKVTDDKGCSITKEVYVDECVDCNLDDKLKDYRFSFLEQEFKSGEEAYLCIDMLPTPIEVFEINGSVVPNGLWEGGTFSNENTPNTILISLDPNGATLTYTFTEEDGTEIVMTLFVRTDVSAEIRNKKGDQYAYDDNQIMGYPHYKTTPKDGIPWKFLETNEISRIQAKAIPTKAYYATVLKGNNIEIVPTPLASKGWNDVTLRTNAPTNETDITVCNSDPLLKVFAADKKEITIDFFLVCESDDDVQVVNPCDVDNSPNGCIEQPSENSVCALGGDDGGFDQSIRSDLWLKGDDRKGIIGNTEVVLAGENKICETKVRRNNVDCPKEVSADVLNEIIENANSIYNSVGVYLTSDLTITQLNINYDAVDNDNSIMEDDPEFSIVHNFPEIRDSRETEGHTPIYILQSLGENDEGNIRGGRAKIGQNSFGVRRDKLRDLNVFSHELGHARYGLLHPDNGDDGFTVNDNENLMFGSIELGGGTGVRLLRKYQWVEIHP